MNKRKKNELGVFHEVKDVEIASSEHNQKENALTTHGTNHYKRGYMAQHEKDTKLGHHCSECKNKSVSQEEFDKMVKVLLNTPPRKRNKKDRNKVVRN